MLKGFYERYHFLMLLLGITVITYGLFAFSLGFFLDDWIIVYYQKFFGGSGFFEFYREDRPFFAYIYRVFLPIFGDSPSAWQIFALFTRWLATLTFWLVLGRLFPAQKKLWKWAAVLFLIYPGFQFHWFAIMYSLVYLLMAVYFLSYWLMHQAVRQRQSRRMYAVYTLAGLLCVVIGIVPMEYFYGMELIRPIVLWFIFRQQDPRPLRAAGRAMLHWLPYLLVFAGFTVYRILYSSEYAYQVGLLDQFSGDLFTALLDLGSKAFWSVFDASVTAWWNLIDLFDRNFRTSAAQVMLALMLLAGTAIFFILSRKENLASGEKGRSRGWVVMLNGLALTAFALTPFIAASFTVSLEFPYNRFLIALAPGIAIFIAGAAEEFLRTEKQKIALVALLSGLAVGSQFVAGRSFLLQWEAQEDFFWQLTWRAPGLEPGTTLVTEEMSFSQYFSGTALTPPLNMIYPPAEDPSNLNYLLMLTASPQLTAIPDFEPGIDFTYQYRGLNFKGSTDALIAFYKPAKGCLRLLSPDRSPEEFSYSHRLDIWRDSIALSNLGQVIADPPVPAVPPEKYFGVEDPNQWCYYYEKADLAWQLQNWDKVIEFYSLAGEAGFAPGNIPEWLPLLEALLQTGQVDRAVDIIRDFSPGDPTETASLCRLLGNTASSPDFSGAENGKIQDMLFLHQCR